MTWVYGTGAAVTLPQSTYLQGEEAPNPYWGSDPTINYYAGRNSYRMRAYHRYLERGGGDGMDFADWLEAERELRPTR